MSEKVLHRVEPTEILRGWSVVEVDGGSVGVSMSALFDNGYQVPRDVLVYELARLAAQAEALRECVRAADAMRKKLSTEEWPQARDYDAARAKVTP